MKRLLAGLLTMVLVTTCAACDAGRGSGSKFSGVKAFDGGTWDVELLAVVRGATIENRGTGQPCLVMFGVLRSATADAFSVPLALPIAATADGVVKEAEPDVCSPDGERLGDGDAFGQWLGWPVAPGAEMAFSVGFIDFEGELPDEVELTIGTAGEGQAVVEATVTDTTPSLRSLAVGSAPPLAPIDTEFQYAFDDEAATQRVLGYDIVPYESEIAPNEGVGACLRLYVEVVVNVEVRLGSPFEFLPKPSMVVDGVGGGTWPGGCSSAPGFYYLGPTTPTDPWPADVPYGVLYTYAVPDDATVQAVLVEDRGEMVAIAVEQLDGPPPAP